MRFRLGISSTITEYQHEIACFSGELAQYCRSSMAVTLEATTSPENLDDGVWSRLDLSAPQVGLPTVHCGATEESHTEVPPVKALPASFYTPFLSERSKNRALSPSESIPSLLLFL